MYGCRVLHDFAFEFPPNFLREEPYDYTVRFHRTFRHPLLLRKRESLSFSQYQGRGFTLTIGKTLLPPFSRLCRIDIPGIGSFHWIRGEEVIRHALEAEENTRRALFWIVRIVLPLYGLLEKNLLLLHAASFRIDKNRAAGIIAPSNTGKSRWIEMLDRMGFPILGDDILALKREGKTWMAHPSYPAICLDRHTETLGATLHNFQRHPLEFTGCFRLGYNIYLSDSEFRKIEGIEKVKTLESAREFHLPIHLKEGGEDHLREWIRWLETVPVWSVSCPRQMQGIQSTILQMRRLIAAEKQKG